MPAKVLVIEDITELREGMLEILAEDGFEAFGAPNGLTGVDLARQLLPDVIVCDIQMPDIRGYDVLTILRERTETALIPFIFVTALSDRNDQRQGMELGASDFITKPFRSTELINAIRVQLDKHQRLVKHSESKLNKLRESLITSLPHEFRTPLNTVIGFSDILATDGDTIPNEQVKEWSTLIHGAGMRLYRLIENYLIYARIEVLTRDPHSLKKGKTNKAPHLLKATAQTIAQDHNRSDDLQFYSDELTELKISDEYLKKIMEELIDNAFKFSQRGSNVGVTGEQIESGCLITITDYGRGFSSEQITQIGAYVQFDRWLHEQQGMGLGLTIAKRLVELHDGSILIDSGNGKTSIMVRLPRHLED
jgi:two-component system, sensor histidine kinase and response regulator